MLSCSYRASILYFRITPCILNNKERKYLGWFQKKQYFLVTNTRSNHIHPTLLSYLFFRDCDRVQCGQIESVFMSYEVFILKSTVAHSRVSLTILGYARVESVFSTQFIFFCEHRGSDFRIARIDSAVCSTIMIFGAR